MGYFIDKNKEKRDNWSEEEMKQGFIEAPVGPDIPEHFDMGRDESMAGSKMPKRVIDKQGVWDIFYDDLGYMIKAIHVKF